MRAAALALTLLALLAGCGREPEKAARPPVDRTPVIFERASPDARVKLTLPPGVTAWPALHQRLLTEGKRELGDFLARATVDRQRILAENPQLPIYERTVAWTITARTDRLVSLQQRWEEYAGGAHGANGAETLLWSKGGEAPVLQSALFRADADQQALDALLCDAVKATKARRMGAVAVDAGDWSCPTWSDSRAVLTNSTVRGKAGGLTFLFDPYVLGPYSEGAYEVTIPQALFRQALAQTWIGEFDGDPVAPTRPRAP